MIEYMGTHKDAEGADVYAFRVNGVPRELREESLKIVPGFYESLPPLVQAQIEARHQNRSAT